MPNVPPIIMNIQFLLIKNVNSDKQQGKACGESRLGSRNFVEYLGKAKTT